MPGVADLIQFLDESPSPWHAVSSAARRLEAVGFSELDELDSWHDTPAAGFVRRGGALIAWRRPDASPREIRIVGAHTDSPGLRIQPRPDQRLANWNVLGVEVYGGVLLNSWLDRDLGIAGRVVDADGAVALVHVAEPIARVPQLAIHLDREVNERGLVLDRHTGVRPVWAVGSGMAFTTWLSEQAGVDVAAYELVLYDVTPAAVLGADRSMLASGRLDNQVSCWAAVAALASAPTGDHLAIAALFDHEEVGSDSSTGASGPFLATSIDRVVRACGAANADDRHRLMARSSCVSADNAHAIHPNYPDRHDAAHAPVLNAGPAIKLNANQRYATDVVTAARFERLCTDAGVPVQRFVSRNNIPCGSTIGPLTATRLGIPTVDVGIPQLSMHSARELCGTADPAHLVAALHAYWS